MKRQLSKFRGDTGMPTCLRHGRSGFTLLEVVVSASVLSIVMVGLASAMVIASKAVTKTTSDTSSGAAAQAVQLIASELKNATAVSELTSNAITFTVPSRNGDANPETIRYAWSGTAGAPLTRQYNGGTAATIIDSVQSLSLTYDKSSTVVTQSSESPEVTLYSYTAALTPGTASIATGLWAGEVFTPSGIPANATVWKITRVQYQARKNGSTVGSTDVQLRTVSGSSPTSTVVDHAAMSEASLGASYAWTTTTFSNAGNLTPGTSMAIVFQWTSDTVSMDLQYDTLLSALSGANYVSTTNSGSTWTAATLKALDLVVYGTYTAPQNTTLYYLQTVGVSLKAGSSSSPTMSTRAQILNAPQVTGP